MMKLRLPNTFVLLFGILALIAVCFPIALQLGRRAIPWGADAAVTFATLCFGAGVALVGQMYHLPGDWPAGAMLVAIGAVVAVFLLIWARFPLAALRAVLR